MQETQEAMETELNQEASDVVTTDTSHEATEPVEQSELDQSPQELAQEAEALSEEEQAMIQESDPHKEEQEKIKQMGRHGFAVYLIDEAKRLVEFADKQIDDCRLLLKEDLQSYDDAKARLKREALDESEALLEELGYDWRSELEATDEPEVMFEPKEQVPPMQVQEVSSGKFGSFIVALISGIATSVAVAVAAAMKTGLAIDFTKVPDLPTIQSALKAVAQSIGLGQDLFIGGGIAALAGLAVYGIVYAVRTGGKAKKNVELAKRQLEEAQQYHAQKWDCKQEMDKVDAHIKDAVDTLRLYEVLLMEQNGKLRRIMHIEGEKKDRNDYHKSSRQTMEETGSLLEAIKAFMATPMSEEGKLSGKSTLFLHRAKERAQQWLDHIYG